MTWKPRQNIRSRARLLILAPLLGTLLIQLGCSQPQPRKPADAKPGQQVLKLMTYNVNYGLAGDAEAIAAIASADADIVLLQETTPAWERAIRSRLSSQYPTIAFEHCCGAGGLAILSKFPIREKTYLQPPPSGWFPAWRVVLDTESGPLQTLNVHLRPPFARSGGVAVGYFTTPSKRRRQIEAFHGHLDPDVPTLVAGDFNEAAGPAIAFLEDRGMRSALPDFAPDAKTWGWATSLGRIEKRLDHVMYEQERWNVLDAQVLDLGRSDHKPVVVRVALRD